VDRRVVNFDGSIAAKAAPGTHLEYKVHYQNGARRYDQWVEAVKIAEIEGSSGKKRTRGRAEEKDQKDQLALPEEAAAIETVSIAVGENFVPEPVAVAAAVVASTSPWLRLYRTRVRGR